MQHLYSQAQAMMSQVRSSPTLSCSSPEPPSTPIASRGPSLSTMHGAMFNHGQDILSKLQNISYSSPPPIACSPESNVCKFINYRGAKIATFNVDGRDLICLPQAFELFLKHLVGGLHTVYTKLKRLDITPVVCNVEQVRVLRGLGAIQPGVNRCKLITCKEFDILYDDCTNSSARPGRPPKRSLSFNASLDTIEKLKKSKLDSADIYSGSRFFDSTKNFLNAFPPHPYTMGHLPFMRLNHPLLSPPVSLAMAQQLGLHHERFLSTDNYFTEHDMVESSDENKEQSSPNPNGHLFHPAYQHKSVKYTTDSNTPLNLHINGYTEDVRKSPNSPSVEPIMDDNDTGGENQSDEDKSAVDSEDLETLPQSKLREVTSENQLNQSNTSNGTLAGYSSIETLLINIQGLMKLAEENVRYQKRQIADLTSDLIQEKKTVDDLEKQLLEEQKQKNILVRRLKKEMRVRQRLEGRGRDVSSKQLIQQIANHNTDKMDEDYRERTGHSQEAERTSQTTYSSV